MCKITERSRSSSRVRGIPAVDGRDECNLVEEPLLESTTARITVLIDVRILFLSGDLFRPAIRGMGESRFAKLRFV